MARFAGPGNLLLLFFVSQLLIYFDRGLISAVLPALASSFELTNSEMGLIGSCFIFGYMLACPLFAFFSRSYSVYKLMSIGLFLWTVAVTLCGLTNNFLTLLGARILTGVGEASFAGLAPACIDDVSPKEHRTLWLSVFFAGLPIGGAIGYITGGQLVNGALVLPLFGKIDWHAGFLLEAALMVPVILTVFAWPDSSNKAEEPDTPLSPPSPDLVRRASLQRQQSHTHHSYGTTTNNRLALAHGLVRRESAPALIMANGSPAVRALITPSGSGYTNILAAPIPIYPQTVPQSLSSDYSRSLGSSFPSVITVDVSLPLNSSDEREPLLASRSQSANRNGSSPSPLKLTPSQFSSSSPSPTDSTSSESNVNGSVIVIPSTPPHAPFLTPHHPNYRTYQLRHVATQPNLLSPLSLVMAGGEDEEERLWYEWRWNAEQLQFAQDCTSLFADNIYVCLILGYASLAFVIGALSFWAPVDFALMLNLSIEESTKAIGVITFFCGITGTGFGGWALDWWSAGKSRKHAAVLAALEICVLFTSISIVCGLLSVALSLTPALSLAFLASAMFFLFATSAPINACLLSVAPPALRSLAMAMTILLMHLLGDLPSPFLMGYITELAGNVRLSLVILVSWLSWTVMFWSFGAILAKRRLREQKLAAIISEQELEDEQQQRQQQQIEERRGGDDLTGVDKDELFVT